MGIEERMSNLYEDTGYYGINFDGKIDYFKNLHGYTKFLP